MFKSNKLNLNLNECEYLAEETTWTLQFNIFCSDISQSLQDRSAHVIYWVKNSARWKPGGGGGRLPYEEYTGVCHVLGSYFQGKIPKRYVNFSQKFRKGLQYLEEIRIPDRVSYFDVTNDKPKEDRIH